MVSKPDSVTSIDVSKVSIMASAESYAAVSSAETELPIPKELFIALREFLETKKCAGSITLQFRCGRIISVESWTKKTYSSS